MRSRGGLSSECWWTNSRRRTGLISAGACHGASWDAGLEGFRVYALALKTAFALVERNEGWPSRSCFPRVRSLSECARRRDTAKQAAGCCLQLVTFCSICWGHYEFCR